jgi:hypothetical protein
MKPGIKRQVRTLKRTFFVMNSPISLRYQATCITLQPPLEREGGEREKRERERESFFPQFSCEKLYFVVIKMMAINVFVSLK